MSLVRTAHYEPDGRLRSLHHDTWAIYAAFADGDEEGLVKIGVSTEPIGRAYSINSANAQPLRWLLWCWVGGKKRAFKLEYELHKTFADRRTRGEWFRFNYADQSDKATFHAESKKLYFALTGRFLNWTNASPEQIKSYGSLMRQRLREKKKLATLQ